MTVHGTLGGQPFSATGAVGLIENLFPGSGFIELPENFDLTCDLFATAPKAHRTSGTPTGWIWDFSVHVDGNSGSPFAPGTYNVVPPNSGVTTMTVDATYKRLPNGDSVTGRFAGPVCSFEFASGPQGPPPGAICLH